DAGAATGHDHELADAKLEPEKRIDRRFFQAFEAKAGVAVEFETGVQALRQDREGDVGPENQLMIELNVAENRRLSKTHADISAEDQAVIDELEVGDDPGHGGDGLLADEVVVIAGGKSDEDLATEIDVAKMERNRRFALQANIAEGAFAERAR